MTKWLGAEFSNRNIFSLTTEAPPCRTIPPLQKLLEAGVSQGVYTAAVALVGLKGKLRWEGAAGASYRTRGPQP